MKLATKKWSSKVQAGTMFNFLMLGFHEYIFAIRRSHIISKTKGAIIEANHVVRTTKRRDFKSRNIDQSVVAIVNIRTHFFFGFNLTPNERCCTCSSLTRPEKSKTQTCLELVISLKIVFELELMGKLKSLS